MSNDTDDLQGDLSPHRKHPSSTTSASLEDGVTLEEFLGHAPDENKRSDEKAQEDYDRDFPPMIKPLLRKASNKAHKVAAHKKGLLISGIVLVVAVVLGVIVWDQFMSEDDPWLQTQITNNTTDTTAMEQFWDSLLLASDTQLQSFVNVCSDRTQCYDELLKLVRGPCIMLHYPPAPLSESNALEVEATNTMTQLLHVLRTNGRMADAAWGVLDSTQFELLASSAIKATTPAFCKATLRNHLE